MKYHKKKPKLNGVYLRNNLSKIKDNTNITNLDECESIGTHWIDLQVNAKTVIYFDRFGVEHIPRGIKTFIRNKSIITNIYRIQVCDSIMWRYFCIGFINFM